MRRILIAAGSLGIALGLLAACGDSTVSLPPAAEEAGASDAGIDAADSGGALCTLPGSFGGVECDQCLATRCCDAIIACEADPNCKPLNRCNLDCTASTRDGGGCRRGCVAQYPTGEPGLIKIDQCGFEPDPVGCADACVKSSP